MGFLLSGECFNIMLETTLDQYIIFLLFVFHDWLIAVYNRVNSRAYRK